MKNNFNKTKSLIVILTIVISAALMFGCSNSTNGNNDIPETTNSEVTVPDGTTVPAASAATQPTNPASTQPAQPVALSLKDYFPLRENTRYIYEGKGNEYAAYDVYVDYTSENRIQQRISNGGTVLVKIIEIEGGKLTKLYSRAEAYYRENLLKTTEVDEEVLLMEPLVVGTKWTLADGRSRSITSVGSDVTTPAGVYKAIEVTTTGPNDKTVDYYAKDVGLVKSVFAPGENEVTSTLAKIEEDVKLTQSISFFYPNIDDSMLYFVNKEIGFKTNDITRKVLESAYKLPVPEGHGLGKVFSENTLINSLYLNKDGMVYIDLNSKFMTEMNAGSMYEGMILQSVTNTFCKYYGANRIILTIDNKFYESGHFMFEKGDYLVADYETSKELK